MMPTNRERCESAAITPTLTRYLYVQYCLLPNITGVPSEAGTVACNVAGIPTRMGGPESQRPKGGDPIMSALFRMPGYLEIPLAPLVARSSLS